MEYMNILESFINNEIGVDTAIFKIEIIIPELLKKGMIKEYAKAIICKTYFQRYKQYNTGIIGYKDLLLFIRDFVMFIGRIKHPMLIANIVERYGTELGVILSSDGAVDAAYKIPTALNKYQSFIQQVYCLGDDRIKTKSNSTGDFYLTNYTNFNHYRSIEQKIAIHSAIKLPNDHTLMVSLPTGGGKSLITQLLAATENKLTLVIVPTVSLAQDQRLQAISSLVDSKIKDSIFSYSSNNIENKNKIINAIQNKTARLIFTSPEAVLESEIFNQVLNEAASNEFLRNIVIDEAHIVPDWGVFFRTEFQLFSIWLNEIRVLSNRTIRTYLLSATLSDDVVKILFDLFGVKGKNVQCRCDALRKEPRFIISESHNYLERQNAVIEMIEYLPKPLIVYVIEPKDAEKYRQILNNKGYKNIFTYTGNTNDENRELLLNKWKNNEIDIMIATSAFGMGVDKANIRTIIHSCVPENLSRFYQEVGRSGRDNLPSLSVLVHYVSRNDANDARNDLSLAFGLIKSSILRAETIINRFNSILEDNKTDINGDLVTADLNTVPNTFSDEEAERAGIRNMSWNINTLLLLHRQEYIKITKIKYSSPDKTYYVSFHINNVDIIKNSEVLLEKLTTDRNKEYEIWKEGYDKIASLVRNPKSKCFGQRFVSLFPYAQPVCQGCPIHPNGTDIKERRITISEKMAVNIPLSPPSLKLKRRIGILKDYLIAVDNLGINETLLLINYANSMGINSIIIPDEFKNVNTKNCLGLTHSEFIEISDKISWLLKDSLMIILNDDDLTNNKIFEIINNRIYEDSIKIWCCNPNIRISSKNRAINEFLNCRTCNINSL